MHFVKLCLRLTSSFVTDESTRFYISLFVLLILHRVISTPRNARLNVNALQDLLHETSPNGGWIIPMNRTGEPTDILRVERLYYCNTCGAFNGPVPSKREALNNSDVMEDDVEIVGVRNDSTQSSEVPKCGTLIPGSPTVNPFYNGFEELLQKFIAESPPVKKQSWVAASQTRGANDQLDGHKLVQNVRGHVKAHLKSSSSHSHSTENFDTQRKHKTLDSSTRSKRRRDKKLTPSGIGPSDSTTLMNKRSKRRQG